MSDPDSLLTTLNQQSNTFCMVCLQVQEKVHDFFSEINCLEVNIFQVLAQNERGNFFEN